MPNTLILWKKIDKNLELAAASINDPGQCEETRSLLWAAYTNWCDLGESAYKGNEYAEALYDLEENLEEYQKDYDSDNSSRDFLVDKIQGIRRSIQQKYDPVYSSSESDNESNSSDEDDNNREEIAVSIFLERESAQLNSSPKPLTKNENPFMPIEAEESKTEALEAKQPACSPLSVNSKIRFVAELKKVNPDLLQKVLIEAALNNQSFPKKINEKLNTLQHALFQNKDNDAVRPHIGNAITGLVTTELVNQFQAILEDPIEIETLNSTFLYFLAKHLDLSIEQNPVVQATIQDGKIYWRILQGNRVIYYHQQEKEISPVVFAEETSWYMDWKLFRTFKDSGKRSSSVEITRELFIAKFGYDQAIAASIWDDLKLAGILNAKNKLSHGWRTLSNDYIKLKTIDDLLWKTQRLREENRSFLYKKTSDTLNRITNNQENAKTIEAMPDTKIYRPELSPKEWKGTGLVLNNSPEDNNHCTRLWDVGVYDELNKHRFSDGEKEKYDGEILHYDHIPSTSILKSKSSIISEYDAEIKRCEHESATANSELKSYIQSQKTVVISQATVTTRQQEKLPVDPTVMELKNRIANSEAKKSKLKAAIEIETETLAFTVAVPEKLHTQGDTFLKSAKAQSLSIEHPFFKDITAYMYMLESRPHEFKLQFFDDYIKALGAFRYLYHTQCKPPGLSVSGEYSIGRIAHSFFQDAAVRKRIDCLFQEKIKSFMTAREGETCENRLGK